MAAVIIPDSLKKRLQGLGPHFCMVYSEQKKHPDPKQDWKKRPVGNDWQNRLMFADDPKLQEWLAGGGNYGVCGGYGLVIADADISEIKHILEEKLPETFTVETPGSKGWHAYFLCGLEKPIRLRDKDGENVGDIQGPGKMVVGPESIHPNGGVYKVVKDVPLAQVTAQELREALKDWIVSEKEIQKVEFAASQEKRNNIDLDVLQVVPLTGLQKRGSEYFGSHPIHGSKGKQNFWVNPLKNCWHCFRHGSGGGPLLWLAVEEGIIDCSEAGPGVLRGEIFKQVLKKAQERGFIEKNKLALEKEKGQTEIFGDSFHLERIGKSVFLLDNEGGAVASCKMKNIDGRNFKKTLKDIIGLKDHEINKITANFKLKHQKHNKKTESKKEPEEKVAFDDETENKARKLLHDPAFFYKLGWVFKRGFIVSKLNKPRFVIGEKRNKRLVGPILIGAAKLGMTSLIKLLGDPATCKDTMLRMWLDLLTIKYVERSFFTAAGLRYSQEMKEADLLYIPDSPELYGEMGRQMRFMRADDGGLISEYATRDAETGEMVTKVSRLPVKAIATTSNALTGDAALESGMWTLRTNATEELTKEVKKEKLKLRAGKRELFPEEELKIWRCAFKILVSEEVPDTLPEVPFAEQLIVLLESGRSASRRDPDKLCDLISLIAWVRRFQKKLDARDDADLVDLYSALQVGLDAITQTISELDEKEERIFNAVGNLSITIRTVTDDTKIPYETCYSYLERLVQKGFLNKDKEKGRNIYSVLGENKPKQLFVSEVKSSENPATLMKFILESFKDSSTLHGGTSLSLIDPLTGNEVTVNTTENNEVTITTENRSYPYPYEELKTFERSPKTPSEAEKEPKQVVIKEIKRENEEKPVETPVSETGVNGDILACCFDCRKTLSSDPQGYKRLGVNVFCLDCYRKLKAQEKWECPEFTLYDGSPFCKVIQSILAKPENCKPDCSLLQEEISCR